VNTALQEDVDVVGLSIHSGAHMTLFPRVRKLLNEKGGEAIIVTGGGIIPEEDMKTLKIQGIDMLFSGLPAQTYPRLRSGSGNDIND
jgi:methylmalonyl-CoA mutase C-terminal domain/subunit